MTDARYKLYHYPATRSARVKWMLHEVLDEDFEVEVVPLYDGAQYQPDYVQINPNHNVPTLEIRMADGSSKYMLESGAMIALLGDAFPEKRLAPPADELSLARADYLQMLFFGASWMDMMLWQIRIHEHLLTDAERDQRTIDRYRAKFAAEVEPQLARRLEKAAYICGDDFCAADCVIAHNIGWARRYGLCKDTVFRAYLSRVSKRPAFALAFADAKQFDMVMPEAARATRRFTG